MIGLTRLFSRVSVCADNTARTTGDHQRIREVVIPRRVAITPVERKRTSGGRLHLNAITSARYRIESQRPVVADICIVNVTAAVVVHRPATEDIDKVARVGAQQMRGRSARSYRKRYLSGIRRRPPIPR